MKAVQAGNQHVPWLIIQGPLGDSNRGWRFRHRRMGGRLLRHRKTAACLQLFCAKGMREQCLWTDPCHLRFSRAIRTTPPRKEIADARPMKMVSSP